MSDDMLQGEGSGSDGRANPAFEHSKEGEYWAFELFHATWRREPFLTQHLQRFGSNLKPLKNCCLSWSL